MDKREIIQHFQGGIDCAQVVAMPFAGEFGYDESELARICAPFGCGMLRGETCGAVTGALVVLGLAYGQSELGAREEKALMMEKVREFQERFIAERGSTQCRALCGYDLSVPGEMEKCIMNGVMLDECPDNVLCAQKILQELL